MTGPARILLVDDSVVVRGLLSRLVDAEPDLEVVGTAANGKIGVQKVDRLQPDVVVLDIEMPEMNGLEALREIRRGHPTLPVVMFSTTTTTGATSTVDALAHGASDYATKPEGASNLFEAIQLVRDELIGKVRALATSGPTARRARASGVAASRSRTTDGIVDALVLGCSTGGPTALEAVLCSIVRPMPVPIFIVQHMPPKFTLALAERLDRKCSSTVVEAEDGDVAEAGTCYIAPGGSHMIVRRPVGENAVIRLTDSPAVNSCRPSVDPLFEAAADVYGSRLLATILTGMGSDGLDGCRRIAELGCDIVVQDEETSVIWGMPGAVANAGLATAILPLDAIGRHLTATVATSGRGRRADAGLSGPYARSASPT